MAVGYVPGILGAADAGRWWLLSICVPVALIWPQIQKQKLTWAHLFGMLLLAWAATSLLWTASFYDGVQESWQWCLFAGLFCLGSNATTLRPVYNGLGLGFAVNSALVIAQAYFSFHGIEQVAAPAGLFMNKDYLGEAAALALVGIIGSGAWPWLLAAVLPSILVTGSRGALIGLAAAGGVALWRRSRLAVCLLAVGAVVGCSMLLNTPSVVERFVIWQDTINGLLPLGNGIGSFFVAYPAHASLKDLLVSRPANAHNDFLEVAFELGLPGALLTAGFFMQILCTSRRTELAVVAAFMMEACFGFPLHNPVTGFIFAVAAGHLCGARHGVHSDFARWRMAIRARTLAGRKAVGSDRSSGARPGDFPA